MTPWRSHAMGHLLRGKGVPVTGLTYLVLARGVLLGELGFARGSAAT